MKKTREIKPGLYRHYNGGLYTAVGVGIHHGTNEESVVYHGADPNKLFVRSVISWTEDVGPNANQKPVYLIGVDPRTFIPRFQPVEDPQNKWNARIEALKLPDDIEDSVKGFDQDDDDQIKVIEALEAKHPWVIVFQTDDGEITHHTAKTQKEIERNLITTAEEDSGWMPHWVLELIAGRYAEWTWKLTVHWIESQS